MRTCARCPQIIPGTLPINGTQPHTNDAMARPEIFTARTPVPDLVEPGPAGSPIVAFAAGAGIVNVLWQLGQVVAVPRKLESHESLCPQFGQAKRKSLIWMLGVGIAAW